MPNRLAEAISPYLRSHADNPVDWFAWGEAAFEEALRRDVPVLISIGYSTCHWCHVMARESFSDPALAAVLNDGFVAIKVDREEHPEVDAFFLAAAGAFTQNLGWPLSVFATPQGRPFFAGTYFPPVAVQGAPAFATVLGAVREAWTDRRTEVEQTGAQLVAALSGAAAARPGADDENVFGRNGIVAGLPSAESFDRVIGELEAYEDTVHGGFGGAPKFPVAPVLGFLLAAEAPLALRTLEKMAASDLRDPVEGGFFRYATRSDWSEPHYERMLYDNALLLDAYTSASQSVADVGRATAGHTIGAGPTVVTWAHETAVGIATFLVDVMQVDGGAFASAQDSESIVDGGQSEGGYYGLDLAERARQVAPKRDEKILTGWNGLAIAALARCGALFGDERWVVAARQAADYVLARHLQADGSLLRVSLGARTSDARATLEDYGMFATALGVLGAVTAGDRYTRIGRQLVDRVAVALADRVPDSGARADDAAVSRPAAEAAPGSGSVFAVPGGGDPVLAARGLLVEGDVSEGAYPSGISAASRAAIGVAVLTGDGRYADLALQALAPIASDALARPIGYGTVLELLYRLRRAS